jgi:hypothetical protein
LQSAGR